MSAQSWRKAGHRSLLHRGYPRMVVRFDGEGKGKVKMLCDEREFAAREIAAARSPERSIEILLKDAESFWKQLNGGKP